MTIVAGNTVFYGLLAGIILFILLLWLCLRDQSDATKSTVLCLLCLFTIIGFFVYKYYLSLDAEFLVASKITSFNWFNELPLQLCNINMFLIPLGLLLKKRPILGFAFFVGPLGALMAILMPEPAFSGYSLLLPRMLGFYGTHALLLVEGISLATLGLYRPKFKDIPGIYLAIIVLGCLIHLVNMLLRMNLCPFANYFYTFGVDISLLELFWSWIPVPLLYELPALVILGGYMLLVIGLFALLPEQKKAYRWNEHH